MRTVPLLLLALPFGSPDAAEATGRIPSLCKPGEFVLATARLQRVDKASPDEAPPEKTVSLCADREKEPIGRLAYRFGTPGAAEAEIVASSRQKAGVFFQSDKDAHVGVVGIVFYAKPYSYVVSEGMGMAGFGLKLLVYKSNRRIAEFTSLGHESNFAIDPDAQISPVFKRVQPIEPL